MITISYHALAIATLLILFLGAEYGEGREKRAKRREQKRIWRRERAKLPRAVR